MDKFIEPVIRSILETPEAWTKDRQLAYDNVIDILEAWKEHWWLRNVWFLKRFEIHGKMQANPAWNDAEWFETEEYGLAGWWPDNPNIADWIEDQTYGYFHRLMDRKYSWMYERPSKEEILALGIMPKLVFDKIDKAGNLQTSLF